MRQSGHSGEASQAGLQRGLLLFRNILRDPRSGLGHIVALGLFLQLCRFLHQLAGAVGERLGPFAFLAGFLTCGQFAFRHGLSLSYPSILGYLRVFADGSSSSVI